MFIWRSTKNWEGSTSLYHALNIISEICKSKMGGEQEEGMANIKQCHLDTIILKPTNCCKGCRLDARSEKGSNK